ncbi:hypothetical protein KVR01_009879 [Diaporthe batatas]|uniref:uncharacterized protein n=1 Tax=Diaporthe batatas TaxID=748121 RepID=UPI001D048408|nr:uncharacterized protein KVR01_009879 [Diaporthe batatas]KAG8160343.1 hypothetical protein KVR01_009879 [Diaporthe batatas]
MSHQRYASHDPVKEPHSISLKVLRLSRPSLVAQHPISPNAASSATPRQPPVPASLAYSTTHDTNPSPFLLSPILNLPPSFGSAYVGETFSCTLCANHEAPPVAEPAPAQPSGDAPAAAPRPSRKYIRDVRIEAEMKTPNSTAVTKLDLSPSTPDAAPAPAAADEHAKVGAGGVDLEPGRTLQRIVNFDLKEEGNHVLGVTVSYYEATETSGRTRTFRKLYQFICKPSLIVRTKASPLAPAMPKASSPATGGSPPTPPPEGADEEPAGPTAGEGDGDGGAKVEGEGVKAAGPRKRRRWVLEAQLENCSEDTTELERVVLQLEPGLSYRDCNWEAGGSPRPVLHPGEVEQVCFVIEEVDPQDGVEEQDGKILFGILGIGWRTEMGQRGYLATNKLGTRHIT